MTTIELTEEERQMVLLALAKLSLERPGFLQFLRGIAEKHGVGELGLPAGPMFDEFRNIHRHVFAPKLAEELRALAKADNPPWRNELLRLAASVAELEPRNLLEIDTVVQAFRDMAGLAERSAFANGNDDGDYHHAQGVAAGLRTAADYYISLRERAMKDEP